MLDSITRWFFLLHIPITLLVDLSPLYPSSPLFAVPHAIRAFYLKSFNDPLLAGHSYPGGWFGSFLFLELVLQLPACIWVTVQYSRNRAHTFFTQFVIFAYSVQVATTTWACLAEVISFETLAISDKIQLIGFYGPYLGIPIAMAIASARRMSDQYNKAKKFESYLASRHSPVDVTEKTVFITGANSGIGFGCVQRLIDDHSIAMTCRGLRLTLILSVRSKAKADSILERLQTVIARHDGSLIIDFVYMDLTSMSSVEAAARELLKTYKGKIDVLLFNAGMAQFTKFDVSLATKQFFTEGLLATISVPKFKIQRLGGKTEDDMGITFQANIFGHYYLAERLKDCMKKEGYIIWMSSLEATKDALKFDDYQANTHTLAYESSKRLMDIIWHSSQNLDHRNFLVHPGYCSTEIASDVVHRILKPLWIWTFYAARFFGSQVHTATAYNGAYSAARIISDPDKYDTRVKWGSGGRWDGEKVMLDTHFDPIEDTPEVRNLMKEMHSLRQDWLARLK